jgi:hypothetical protein
MAKNRSRNHGAVDAGDASLAGAADAAGGAGGGQAGGAPAGEDETGAAQPAAAVAAGAQPGAADDRPHAPDGGADEAQAPEDTLNQEGDDAMATGDSAAGEGAAAQGSGDPDAVAGDAAAADTAGDWPLDAPRLETEGPDQDEAADQDEAGDVVTELPKATLNIMAASCAAAAAYGVRTLDLDGSYAAPSHAEVSGKRWQDAAAFLRANREARPETIVIHLRRGGHQVHEAAGRVAVAWGVFAHTLNALDALDAAEAKAEPAPAVAAWPGEQVLRPQPAGMDAPAMMGAGR